MTARVSVWVWVILAFAISYALLRIVEAQTMDAAVASAIFFATAPALVAAALIYIAPRSRIAQVAAFGFVAPLVVSAVRLFLAGPKFLLPGMPSDSYVSFAGTVGDVTGAIADFGFVFELLAILALAAYVGRVRTRLGWLIVAASAVLAAAKGVAIAGSWPPIETFPAHLLALQLFAQLTAVAWGYLLAVAVEKRRLLLSVAAAAVLVANVFGLLTATVLPNADGNSPGDLLASVYSGTFWVLDVVFWLSLIGAVLIELPRDRDQASSPFSAETKG